jgi:LPXTG-motif cell wall-anchored protein
MHNRRLSSLFLPALLLCFFLSPPARAEQLVSLPSLNGLGTFSGSFTYTASDATQAEISVVLTNTSASGGYLTGFAFNNPGNQITGVAFSSVNFTLIGGSSFQNGINAAPFGQFDLGAAVGGDFQGGGNPSPGLAKNQTGTFTFQLTGTGLNTLNTNSFFSTLSTGNGDGQGPEAFVARFRGFPEGIGQPGSDKTPGTIEAPGAGVSLAPEPGSFTLAGLALAGLAGFGWLRRKSARTQI